MVVKTIPKLLFHSPDNGVPQPGSGPVRAGHAEQSSNISAVTQTDNPPTASNSTGQSEIPGIPSIRNNFLEQILEPVTGTIPDFLNTAFTITPGALKQKFTIKHSGLEENDPNFLYTFNFGAADTKVEVSGPEIIETPDGSKTISARIDFPSPDSTTGWTPEQVTKIQDAFRSATIADPKLYKRYLSKTIELEDFQEKAVEKALDHLQKKKRSLIVLPTGTGKTVTAWATTDRYLEGLRKKNPNEKPGKVFFVVNNKLILEEAESKLKEQFPGKYSTSRLYGNETDLSGDIIFATPTYLKNNLYEIFKQEIKIAQVIYDEAHHLPANVCLKTYDLITKNDSDTAILGLSATPERMDGKNVLEHFDNEISFQLELDEATRRGFLPRWKIDEYAVKLYMHGDERASIGENEYKTGNAVVSYQKILQAYRAQAGDKPKTLIMAPTVEEADSIASFLRKEGVGAVALTGKTKSGEVAGITDANEKERYFNDYYQAWKTGDWPKDSPFNKKEAPNVAVGVELFREGVDIPGIELLILGRYTDSLPLLTQIVGRGLRPSPYKTKLTIADLVGQISQLDFLGYLASIIEKRADVRQEKPEQYLEREVRAKDGGINIEGLELDRDGTETLVNFFKDIPLLLARRYETYGKIKADLELKKLDRYIAAKLYPNTEEGWEDKLKTGLQELCAQAVNDPDSVREQLKPALYPNLTKPEDYGTSIPLTNASRIVFERLKILCGDDQVNTLIKILPEFKERAEGNRNNLIGNLKFLREHYFKAKTRETMFTQLKDKFYNELDEFSAERELLDDFTVDFDEYGICHDFAFIEGEKIANCKKDLYSRNSRRFLTQRLINLYLIDEKLAESKVLEPEDFGLKLSEFKYKLAKAGLLDDKTSKEAYLIKLYAILQDFNNEYQYQKHVKNLDSIINEILTEDSIFDKLIKEDAGTYFKKLDKLIDSINRKINELSSRLQHLESDEEYDMAGNRIRKQDNPGLIRAYSESLTNFKKLLKTKLDSVRKLAEISLDDQNKLILRKTEKDRYELVISDDNTESDHNLPIHVFYDDENQAYILVGNTEHFREAGKVSNILKYGSTSTACKETISGRTAEFLHEYFSAIHPKRIYIVHKSSVSQGISKKLKNLGAMTLYSENEIGALAGIKGNEAKPNAELSSLADFEPAQASTGNATIPDRIITWIKACKYYLSNQLGRIQNLIKEIEPLQDGSQSAKLIAEDLRYLLDRRNIQEFTHPAMDKVLDLIETKEESKLKLAAFLIYFLLRNLETPLTQAYKNQFQELLDLYTKLVSASKYDNDLEERLNKFCDSYWNLLKGDEQGKAFKELPDAYNNIGNDLGSLIDSFRKAAGPEVQTTAEQSITKPQALKLQAYFAKTEDSETIQVFPVSNVPCKVQDQAVELRLSLNNNGTVHLDPNCEDLQTALETRPEKLLKAGTNKRKTRNLKTTVRYVSTTSLQSKHGFNGKIRTCKECCKDSSDKKITPTEFLNLLKKEQERSPDDSNTLNIDPKLIYHFP